MARAPVLQTTILGYSLAATATNTTSTPARIAASVGGVVVAFGERALIDHLPQILTAVSFAEAVQTVVVRTDSLFLVHGPADVRGGRTFDPIGSPSWHLRLVSVYEMEEGATRLRGWRVPATPST